MVERAVSIEDLRQLARVRLPKAIFDFIDGAAGDEVSLRGNRSQFDRFAFVPHPLNGASTRDQSVTWFGRRYSSPLGISPTGLAGLAWPGADLALAAAAAAHGVPFTTSSVASTSLESIAAEVPGSKWFQLYIFRDRSLSESLLQRAAAAGFDALVVTVDCPVGGRRERDPKNRFAFPLRLSPRIVVDALLHPRWALRMAAGPWPLPANFARPNRSLGATGLVEYMNRQLDPGVTWHDVARFRQLWPHTFIVKGILSVADAARAVEIGAHGIVLSNHGGRQLDGAIAPLRVLPEVIEVVDGRITVLCDSGFRRGSDILKAVALGAAGVLIGRPSLYGVAAAGQIGARRAIAILREEIDNCMALLGCRSIGDVKQGLIRDLECGVRG
jgi:isopentenyl diphosphate isomerase/L-lactate dehydrogenase-like FMN-dependent dehydrogenase